MHILKISYAKSIGSDENSLRVLIITWYTPNGIRIYVSLITTISLLLFSGILASLSAAIGLAPDDIPTCVNQDDQSYKMRNSIPDIILLGPSGGTNKMLLKHRKRSPVASADIIKLWAPMKV